MVARHECLVCVEVHLICAIRDGLQELLHTLWHNSDFVPRVRSLQTYLYLIAWTAKPRTLKIVVWGLPLRQPASGCSEAAGAQGKLPWAQHPPAGRAWCRCGSQR